jgi:hypothetical protein
MAKLIRVGKLQSQFSWFVQDCRLTLPVEYSSIMFDVLQLLGSNNTGLQRLCERQCKNCIHWGRYRYRYRGRDLKTETDTDGDPDPDS